ncbi:MAG: DUF975 family protein [Treponema sp.]|nr:DUF975 family protein [Spirochaetia bacterium]MDY2840907.1 DUF975 family protein [Treponema sp.]
MIFDRKKYKNFAKQQLQGRWGTAVLVTFIICLITSLFSIPDVVRMTRSEPFIELVNSDSTNIQEMAILIEDVSNSATSSIAAFVQMLVEAVLEMAALAFFLKMSRSPDTVFFTDFIEGFNSWLRAILACLWNFLWVFLWSLLFIIPGIIKGIAYSQIYYILSEFKNVSVTKAMKISIAITKGHKADIFVSYLSFIGWDILAAIPCGLGYLWLIPYKKMTFINIYHALMKEALETGVIKPEDLQ